MPAGLHRTYGAHHLHFITCSCYRRLPFLGRPRARDCFLSILEQMRARYRFVVIGYVVMPEHIHLLVTEPEIGSPSTVMQVLKQRTAHALLPKRKRRDSRQRELFGDGAKRAFWQARFYDFNVWSGKKRVEKLRYMHRNPVNRGLAPAPEHWRRVPHFSRAFCAGSGAFPGTLDCSFTQPCPESFPPAISNRWSEPTPSRHTRKSAVVPSARDATPRDSSARW